MYNLYNVQYVMSDIVFTYLYFTVSFALCAAAGIYLNQHISYFIYSDLICRFI